MLSKTSPEDTLPFPVHFPPKCFRILFPCLPPCFRSIAHHAAAKALTSCGSFGSPPGTAGPPKVGRACNTRPEQMLICPFTVCAGRVTSRPSGERPSVQWPPPTQSSSSSSKSREKCRVVGSHFRLIIAGAKSAGFCQTWGIACRVRHQQWHRSDVFETLPVVKWWIE